MTSYYLLSCLLLNSSITRSVISCMSDPRVVGVEDEEASSLDRLLGSNEAAAI